MKSILKALALALVALALAHGPAAAQEAKPDHGPDAEAVAHEAMTQLRSPVTASHTLDMCPAAEAIALRDTVRLAAAQGQTVDEIVEGVVSRYGERVRTLPRREGFGLWAWLAPPLALGLGAIGVAFAARRLRGRNPVPAGPPISAEERARLDAAIRSFDRGEGG